MQGETLNESEKLEAQAIALYKKNKFILSMQRETMDFFRNMANFNQWENLKKELQK